MYFLDHIVNDKPWLVKVYKCLMTAKRKVCQRTTLIEYDKLKALHVVQSFANWVI